MALPTGIQTSGLGRGSIPAVSSPLTQAGEVAHRIGVLSLRRLFSLPLPPPLPPSTPPVSPPLPVTAQGGLLQEGPAGAHCPAVRHLCTQPGTLPPRCHSPVFTGDSGEERIAWSYITDLTNESLLPFRVWRDGSKERKVKLEKLCCFT